MTQFSQVKEFENLANDSSVNNFINFTSASIADEEIMNAEPTVDPVIPENSIPEPLEQNIMSDPGIAEGDNGTPYRTREDKRYDLPEEVDTSLMEEAQREIEERALRNEEPSASITVAEGNEAAWFEEGHEAAQSIDRLYDEIEQGQYTKEAPFIVDARKQEVDEYRAFNLARANYAFDKGYFNLAKEYTDLTLPDTGIEETVNPIEMLAPQAAVLKMLGATKLAWKASVAAFPLDFGFSYSLEDSGYAEEHPVKAFIAEMAFGVVSGGGIEAGLSKRFSSRPKVSDFQLSDRGPATTAVEKKAKELRKMGRVEDANILVGRGRAEGAKGLRENKALELEARAAKEVDPVAKAKLTEGATILRNYDSETIREEIAQVASKQINDQEITKATTKVAVDQTLYSRASSGYFADQTEMPGIELAATAGFRNETVGKTIVEKRANLEAKKIRKAVDKADYSDPKVQEVLSTTSGQIKARTADLPQEIKNVSKGVAESIDAKVASAQVKPTNVPKVDKPYLTPRVERLLKSAVTNEYYGKPMVMKTLTEDGPEGKRGTEVFDTTTAFKHVRKILKARHPKASKEEFDDLVTVEFNRMNRKGLFGEDFQSDLDAEYQRIMTMTKGQNPIAAYQQASKSVELEYETIVKEAYDLRLDNGASLMPGLAKYYYQGDVSPSRDARFSLNEPGGAVASKTFDQDGRRYRMTDWDPIDHRVTDEGTFNFTMDSKVPRKDPSISYTEAPKSYPKDLSLDYASFTTQEQVNEATRSLYGAFKREKFSKTTRGGSPRGQIKYIDQFKTDTFKFADGKSIKILPDEEIEQLARLFGWDPSKLQPENNWNKRARDGWLAGGKQGEQPTVYYTDPDEIYFNHTVFQQREVASKAAKAKNPKRLTYSEENWKALAAEQEPAKNFHRQYYGSKSYQAQRLDYIKQILGLDKKATITEVNNQLEIPYASMKKMQADIQKLGNFADVSKAKRALALMRDSFTGKDEVAKANKALLAEERQKLNGQFFGDDTPADQQGLKRAGELEAIKYQTHGTNVELREKEVLDLAREQGWTYEQANAQYAESMLGDEFTDIAKSEHVGQMEDDLARLMDEGNSYDEAVDIYLKDKEQELESLPKAGEVEDMAEASMVSDELGTGAQVRTVTDEGAELMAPGSKSFSELATEIEYRSGHKFSDATYSPSASGRSGHFNMAKVNSVKDVQRSFKAFDELMRFDDMTISGKLLDELETETPAMIKDKYGFTPSSLHDTKTTNGLVAMLEDSEAQLLHYAQIIANNPGDHTQVFMFAKSKAIHDTLLSTLRTGKASEDAWQSFKGLDMQSTSDRELIEKIEDTIIDQPERFKEVNNFANMLAHSNFENPAIVSKFLANAAEASDKVGSAKALNKLYQTKAKLSKKLEEVC